jgi:NAD(P)H-flavin reductase
LEIVLQKVAKLSESTLAFRFVPAGGGHLKFKPGQFYRFKFTDKRGEFERSYSLCNLDDSVVDGEIESDVLDLVISQVEDGRATDLLFNAVSGLKATVSGPYGRLVLPHSLPTRIVLIATSVGLAPYLPMLRQLEAPLARNEVQLVLLFGIRDESEFLYSKYLSEFEQRHSLNVDLRVCISREPGVTDSSLNKYVSHGYVQSQLNLIDPVTSSDLVMLCGNPHMVDACFEYLKSEGLGGKQIIREKYVFAKDPAEQPKVQKLTVEQRELIAEKMKKFKS